MELADRIPLIILPPNAHLFHGAFKGHHHERCCTHKRHVQIEAENKNKMSKKSTIKEINNKYTRRISYAPLVSSAQIPW